MTTLTERPETTVLHYNTQAKYNYTTTMESVLERKRNLLRDIHGYVVGKLDSSNIETFDKYYQWANIVSKRRNEVLNSWYMIGEDSRFTKWEMKFFIKHKVRRWSQYHPYTLGYAFEEMDLGGVK